MLRYCNRFILLSSRNLLPLEGNRITERNVNIQNSRFASSKIHESRKNLPKKNLPVQIRDNKRTQKTRHTTTTTEAATEEEDETEKFINSLTNRGDFYGVKSFKPASEPVSVEIAVSKLKTWLGHNQRISAGSLVKAVLIPLQQMNPAMLNMIKLDPSYIPYFIHCCGLVLSDVSEDQKLLILEHLLQAFKDNGIKMDIPAYNALLKVWLENNCEFDVHKILEKVEVDLKLEPDVEFYNHLLWRLAELKDVKEMEKMILKMSSRGIMPDIGTELAQIFAASATNSDEKIKFLHDKFLQKYGREKLPDFLSARIRGTLVYGNINKLRKLLRFAVIDVETIKENSNQVFPSRYVLNISYDALFDVIWRLAKLSQDGDGQEYTALSEQILESAQRSTGFFKRLIRETERHIAHKYYYSAAAIIGDTTRVQHMLDSQRKDTFKKQLMPRLANHMIRNRTSNEIIKDVANRLIVYFGPELRFYDDLAFSILMFKGYDYDERFKMFSTFVDAFDPERSRPHLILPLLVRCPDLQTKHTLLFRTSEIGYTDFSSISPFMMAQHFYQPMLECYMEKRRGTDIEKLTIMSKVLESFNIKPEQTWKTLFEYMKDVEAEKHIFRLPVVKNNLKKWLSNEYEKMFKDKVAEAEKKKAKYTYEVFQRLLKNQDVERIHSFLIQRGGFPLEMNYNEDIDTLLEIYLRHANFGYIKKLLHLISNATHDSSPFNLIDEEHGEELQKPESPLNSSHLLRILNRYYHDVRNLQSVIEYVFELRRLFPDVVVTMETRYDSTRQFERLFGAIFASNNVTTTSQSLHECIDLLTSLLKHDFIFLLQNETATVFIIEKVILRFGWDAAVDTWLKLQSSFGCTNGIFSLMKYAIEQNDNTKMQYLLHRAKNFTSSSRVNSLLAGAYLYKDEYEKAKEIFEKEHENLVAHDCVNVFQLLMYLKKDGVLNFVELCLKYTNLRSDQKRTNFFIRGVATNYQGNIGTNPLKFYVLLKKYGVYFDKEQMEKLSNLLKPSKNAFTKWVFDPKTALLNDTKLMIESEYQQMLNEFEKDFETIKNGGKIESSILWEGYHLAAADEDSSTVKVVENRIN